MVEKKSFIFSLLAVAIAVAGLTWLYFASTEVSFSQIVISSPDGEHSVEYGSMPSLSYPDFFNTVKKELVHSKESFIEADLSSMIVRVYKNGAVVAEVPIKTKGKEGSWWETPAGLYKIESKEESHFSSFGHVYQPWSMSFQGNFFIHGWPHYEDGSPVSSTFSGGCIRLTNEDAKKVYDEAEVGMPVLVYEKDFSSDGFVYEGTRPNISAQEYLVADLKNNAILFEREGGAAVPVASLTKLITALTAAEYINMDKPITITSQMIASTSIPRLREGESVKAFHLLYPLLMESSNEAAEALSLNVGKKYFVSLMNKKAQALGMKDTHFTDPAGREAGNVSTARDLFALARYIYHNRSFVFDITTGDVNEAVYGAAPFQNLENFNIGAGEQSFVGGKVGKTTAAKETALSVFQIRHKGETRPLVFIVLGSEDRESDILKLREHVESLYQ